MPPTLLHVFPTLAIGGQQTRFATIANHLGRAFRHRLISLDGRDAALVLLDPTLDAAFIPQPPQTSNPLELFANIIRLCTAVRPDILVTYNWGSIDWVIANRLRAQRPHIHLEDGFGTDEADQQKWRRLLTRRLALQRSTLIVPSRSLETIALTRWWIRRQRVVYIPNGIDATRFDGIPTNGAPFLNQRDGNCIIGAFSPLRQEKNIGRLLRAFAELDLPALQLRLVICGDGPERISLSGLADRLGVTTKVTFTGHVPRPELVMGAFDIFAITSDTEQMPYSVLEAMSARLPVVSTAVGDIKAMVAEENRPFIVPRDAPDRLVSALARLCGDAELRHRIGRANRIKVEQSFRIAPMVEAFHSVLLQLLSGDRASFLHRQSSD